MSTYLILYGLRQLDVNAGIVMPPQEYYNCNIVSFPSSYEGFGMPIIEGQAI